MTESKIIKKVTNTALWIFTGFVTLFLLVYFLLHFSFAQTWVVNRFSSYLSSVLHTQVVVQRVHISFPRSFVLEGIKVDDLHGNPLLSASQIKIEAGKINFNNKEILLKDVAFTDAMLSLRVYNGDEQNNLKFISDYFSSADTTASKPFTAEIENILFKNCSFSYVNENMTMKDGGVDPNDLKVTVVSGEIKNFRSAQDSVFAKLSNFELKEKSGFVLNDFSTDITMLPGMLAATNLNIETAHSKINSDIALKFGSLDDFDDFETLVNLNVNLKKSIISLDDAAYFESALAGIEKSFFISGKIKGTISALKVRELVFEYGHDTKLSGDISINGLPNIQSAFIECSINNFTTTPRDAETIPVEWKAEKKKFVSLPDNIKRLGKISFKGRFTGFYNDFVAYGNLNTALGFASTDINFKTNTDTKKTSYSGKLTVSNFNAGKFAGNENIGNVSFNLALKGSGFSMKELVEEVNGTINNFEFKGYNYRNIALNGNLARKLFKGTFSIHEPNADIDFDGSIDLNGEQPEYNFAAIVNYLNLDNLKLVEAGKEQQFRTKININARGNSLGNLEGSLLISDTYYHFEKTLFYVNSIGLNSFGFGKGRTLYLRSDFGDGEVSGQMDAKHLMSSLKEFMSHYIPNAYHSKDLTIYNQNASFRFTVKNADLLVQLFAPTLHIETGTELSGRFNSAENIFSFSIISPAISFKNIRLTDFAFAMKNDSSSLEAELKTRNIAVGEGINIALVGLNASANNDIVKFTFTASDVDTFPNRLNLAGNYHVLSPAKAKLAFEKSSVFISNEEWKLSQENNVDIDSAFIRFNKLTLSRDNQYFGLDGIISRNNADLLEFAFDNFSMNNFNPALSNSGFQFGGVMNGKLALSGIYSKLNVLSALTIQNLCLNKDTIGNASINSEWNDEKEELTAKVNVVKGTKKIIDISGKYFPASIDSNFDFAISLSDIYLHPFEKFIDDVFSQLYGKLSGELVLTGTSADPQLNGKLKITKGNFILNFLNTRYSFTDEIIVTPTYFGFNNLTLNDMNGSKAILNGKLSHNHFDDLALNLRMDADKFQCMNTNYTGTDIYYGTANASGFVTLDGPVKSLSVDLNLTSEKGTRIFFPLESSSEISQNNFVTFINRNVTDTLTKRGRIYAGGVSITSNVVLTPDAEIQLIFDEKIGDIIKGRGYGNLKLTLTPEGEFSINGNVVIQDGDYLFTLKNVINKKFIIDPGGIISFSGDPFNADVNLTSTYRTRTSLSDLIPNDSSYLTRQTVDCKLILSDKLFNPKVKFDIQVPGGDATTQGLIDNVLSSEEEMSKQVISLLVLGRFQPLNRGAGTVGNYQGSAGANASELLSNQVSNWLSQVSKDVNISLNYRARDAISSEEIEVMLSRQFNEKFTVDANIGVTGDKTVAQDNATAQNTIIGDFNVEYRPGKSKDSKIRLKAFNRTNNNTLITNNSPYTQGVGIFYRVEFDRLRDLWKKSSPPKL